MNKEIIQSITSKILALQDENKCWHVLHQNDKYYPVLNYYVPKYKSTLWTLILLADIRSDNNNQSLNKAFQLMSSHFLDPSWPIYSLGKTHFPIPCLNGNMLYLHAYFHFENNRVVTNIIDFFAAYQRFDDGDFKTPSSFPYCSNRSCYGKHTCYWGIVKLFKGLSFIPVDQRSSNAKILIKKCIDFILLHEVCFSSHDHSQYLHTNIKNLTFPNMYQSDFLEILWLLKREKVNSVHINKALMLLKNKMQKDYSWKMERPIKDLIIPIGNKNFANEFITERAREVLDYYG